jgi:hypothetical protein
MQSSSGQTIPVPEYYGIYVVVDGSLVKLDAKVFHAEKYTTVQFGQRNSVANIVNGQPAAVQPANVQIPVFPADLKIVIFTESSGGESPLDIAKSLHLVPLVYVKNLAVDTGFPSNIKRTGAENGWDDGDPAELVMSNISDRVQELEFLIKPLQGQKGMVIAGLAEKLSPGVYRLKMGENDPIQESMASWTGGSNKGLAFAVEPVSRGEAEKCVNESLSYMMSMSKTAYASCAPVSESGSTLASSMEFIQEKLSHQGQIRWSETKSSLAGVTYRIIDMIADVKADPATCTLTTTETIDTNVDLSSAGSANFGGKLITADDMHTHIVETGRTPFEKVKTVLVEKIEDSRNKVYESANHPEISVTVTPTVFYVMLYAPSAVISAHTSTSKGNKAPVETDSNYKTNGLAFRDYETANRVAKAMIRAIELCGGVTK